MRTVLGSTSHREAVARSRALCGKGTSVQPYNILSRIAALDAVLTPQDQTSVVEIHPELAFMLLAEHVLPPKTSPAGFAARYELIASMRPDVDEKLVRRPAGCARDDVRRLRSVVVRTQSANFVTSRVWGWFA